MYVYTHITVHNPTGMRAFQIYLLCSETTVPCISTMVPSAVIVFKKYLSFLGYAAETQIIACITAGISIDWDILK